MTSKTYDRATAEALTPLLGSILAEVHDRQANLRKLETDRRCAKNAGSDDAELIAAIANEKRELRHAREEATQLGCEIEEGDAHSLSVRIPGPRAASWLWKPGNGLEEFVPTAA